MPPICNRQYGGSCRDCRYCRTAIGWLECPPEARGLLVPLSVAAAAMAIEQPHAATFIPAISGFADIAADPPLLSKYDQHAQSRAMGFTGDLCDNCGSTRMTRNGTCVKCNDCGETSGCS